eukprot:CCRYP_016861-RA/>CCRYP_016861-RA protein AED:0.01 eAED:0.01 QI:186/1/1/1/1/1/3/192/1437
MTASHGQAAYATKNITVQTGSLSGSHTSHVTNASSAASLVLSYNSADATVDYDTNVTPLYEAIGNSDWDRATQICEGILSNKNNGTRNDVATWVVRYNNNNGSILWRFLPIHSTCALSPPHTFLRLLIQLHPASVRTRDHQGLLPLHYACGARCSRECIYTLLMNFPQGSMVGDPRGMLPLHYLGQWGPNEGSNGNGSGIVEMMLVATGDLANTRDKDGNTPLKLAQNASYPKHTEVANQIANHIMRKGLHLSNSLGNSPKYSLHQNSQHKNNAERYASFEDDITMDTNMQQMDLTARKNHGYSNALVSFGDLLEEEEERLDTSRHDGRSDKGGEVRDNIEFSLGVVRTPRGNNAWNKLGISPVHNTIKANVGQHNLTVTTTATSNDNNKMSPRHSWDNRSIMSDPVTCNNQRVVSSPRVSYGHVQQDVTKSTNPEFQRTDPTPKMGPRRSFSWDVQDTATPQAENVINLPVTATNIIDKYLSPRHSRDPSARQGLPPMSPRVMTMSNQRSQPSSSRLSLEYISDARDDKESSAREGVDPAPGVFFDLAHHHQGEDKVSRGEFEKMKTAKEEFENKVRILKIEKEQIEMQLKASTEEKLRDVNETTKKIQNEYEERLEEERTLWKDRETYLEREKKSFVDRERQLSDDLDQGRKRIAELECQLNELRTYEEEGKSAFSEREANLSQELDEERKRNADLERQVNEMKRKIAANDNSFAELTEEKKRSAELEAQVNDLKIKIDTMQKAHGEAVYSHLQEVRSLRTSLEKATVEIEKSRAQSQECSEQSVKEMEALEKQYREDMAVKENRWKEECAKLEGELKEERAKKDVLNPKQQENWMAKENEWNEERAKLESRIRSLTETSWGAQNSEYALKAELLKKEQSWQEDRARLEAEVKHLKDIVKESGSDGYSLTASLLQNHPTSICENSTHMKLQLDTIMREAEEMRKFNSAIRKEHGATIADLESELEKERASKKDLLSEIVTLQYKVSKLESELEEREGSVEVALYGIRSKYRGSGSMDEAEQTRRAIDAIKKDAEGREKLLRDQLNNARRRISELEDELYSKSYNDPVSHSTDYSCRQQLNEARDQIRHLEEKERSLKKELEDAASFKYKLNATREELSKKEEYHRDQVSELESKICVLEEREQSLKMQLKDLDGIKSGVFSSDQERTYYHQLRSIKNQLQELQEREDSYLKEIRELKKKITELEANDHGIDAKLWEAKKSQQWALQEKEDEFNTKIREIKKEYENTLLEKQNLHLKEIREVKKELLTTFREKEDSYMQQLRDAKRREQTLQEREDDLIKQIQDAHLKNSIDDLDIEGMLRKKDDEFARLLEESTREKQAKISELTIKIEHLEQELQDKEDAESIKRELLECKKELEKQRRKHKSEVNKLNNTLELQKSKENRLQAHIQSMESQITGMVSDYESRLEEAYYANIRS